MRNPPTKKAPQDKTVARVQYPRRPEEKRPSLPRTETPDRPQPLRPEDKRPSPRARPQQAPLRRPRPQDRPLRQQLFDERTATFFVVTVHGLEEELAAEIVELAKDLNVELPEPPMVASAGVYLRAPWTFAIAMNFSLRCASRILCEIFQCEAGSLEDVYKQVEKLNWPRFFKSDKTFVVTANSSDPSIKAPALTLKIKDALVDSFRRQNLERPNVGKEDPQVRVMARLHRRTLSVSLDTTGVPLSQRGYRVAGGDAPLSELLAAGLLRMTGWSQLCRALRTEELSERVSLSRVASAAENHSGENKSGDSNQTAQRRIPASIPLAPELMDPMCGTGTFSIEAALQLINRRPQIERNFFAFECLTLFPESALRQTEFIRRQVRSQEISLADVFEKISHYRLKVLKRTDAGDGLEPPIRCSDRDARAVESANRNAKAAGVSKLIQFRAGNVTSMETDAPEGLIVMNPPYGVRLGEEEDLKPFYKSIGDTLKKNCRGWQAWILAGSEGLAGSVGLRATRRKKVFNGGLECLWLQYVLF